MNQANESAVGDDRRYTLVMNQANESAVSDKSGDTH